MYRFAFILHSLPLVYQSPFSIYFCSLMIKHNCTFVGTHLTRVGTILFKFLMIKFMDFKYSTISMKWNLRVRYSSTNKVRYFSPSFVDQCSIFTISTYSAHLMKSMLRIRYSTTIKVHLKFTSALHLSENLNIILAQWPNINFEGSSLILTESSLQESPLNLTVAIWPLNTRSSK